MATVKVTRTINAPMDLVFQTVSDLIPPDPRAERQSHDDGLRDYRVRVPSRRVRIHNEIHDTEWDSLFTLAPSGAGTVLTMCMTTRSHRLFPRLLIPVVCLLIKKSVERDFDAVKTSCEASA